MGRITSGVGLISGLNTSDIIDRLIALEARPRDQLQTRIRNLDAQRTAYLEISARLTALLSRITTLGQTSTFRGSTVASSNADVLSATVGDNAQPGAHSFIVKALATVQQIVSSGFRERDAALPTGSLTIESAQARVDRQTRLGELNGFAGVQRGSFKLTDGRGVEARINIADALTLGEVVDRINSAGLNIRAAVRDDQLVLTETSGGAIHVRESDGGRTAADLGFRDGNINGTGTLSGVNLSYVTNSTPLSGLNDGRGIRRSIAGGDFRVTNSAGEQFTVDLSGILSADTRVERLNHGQGANLGRIRITNRTGHATEVDLTELRTIGDVKAAIESANAGVTVVLTGGRLIVSDTTSGTSNPLKIEDLSGAGARDLGIAGTATADRIDGKTILRIDSLVDVLNAINYATGNNGGIRAAISGTDRQRLTLSDIASGGAGQFSLSALNGSNALNDLGFAARNYAADQPAAGSRIVGGVDTVLLSSLNGGKGVPGGTIRIAAAGTTADVDVANAETLQDVIDAINQASASGNLGVEADYDNTGTRVVIRNTNGAGAPISISDVNGTMAASLGLAQTGASISSNNLQRQYINENTRLSDLNAGRGVSAGRFKVTDSNGRSATIDVAGATTLGDVIRRVNAAGLGAQARINDTGDGLALVDTAGGTGALKVEEQGGVTGRDLNLLGSSDGGRIDGAFETTITVQAGQTLNDLVTQINAKSGVASASVLNDGTGESPFRLNLTARATGSVGEFIVDGAALGVDFSTLSRAQDARVLVGNNPSGGVLVTSASNTLTNVLDGVTLNLSGVSDQPVTVTIDRSLEKMNTALKGLVSDFNAAMDRIDQLSDYNPDNQQAGPLLGESTLQTLQSRLFRLVSGGTTGPGGAISRLSQIGIRLGDGARLTLDEAKLEAAYVNDPEAVTAFFTTAATGLAARLKTEVGAITKSDGLLDRRGKALQDQKDLLGKRVDQLNGLLDRRKARLTLQFQQMEEALSNLQSQQNSLSNIQSLTSN